MYFDAIIASAIVDELHDLVGGGRVQKIIDLNAHDVGYVPGRFAHPVRSL